MVPDLPKGSLRGFVGQWLIAVTEIGHLCGRFQWIPEADNADLKACYDLT